MAGAALVVVLLVGGARAEVSRVDLTVRRDVLGGQSFGTTGPYEHLAGRIHFTIDPRNPRNAVITDLDRARVNADGLVELSADLVILTPKDPARGNGSVFLEVVNRGRKLAMAGFNAGSAAGDLTTEAEFGDGLLLRRGFTIVWVGWEFDAPRGANLMGIDVPVAEGVTGLVRGLLVPTEAGEIATFGDLQGYRSADPRSAQNALAVVDHRTGAQRRLIPRERWRLDGNRVTLDGGFEPGSRYELAYVAEDPPVAGLGFAAVRDTIAWIRHHPGAPVSAGQAVAFGRSQSGRFLRDFLYHGFNTDEDGRQVFDGVLVHIAGSSRTNLNRRWPTTVSQGMFTATSFPFADARMLDPASGAEDGLLENVRVGDHRPKVMYTNTSVEYWGGGRVAALLHVAPDGSRDLDLDANTRVYLLAGSQHGPSVFPPAVTSGAQLNNPNDYGWAMRALLVAMERWVRDGASPPPSRYPSLTDRTLVPVAEVAVPVIPGFASPRQLSAGVRVANDLLDGAGAPGEPLPLLVPQVDADGNETAGILLPDVAVPVATHTSWNHRRPAIGSPDQLYPLLGSYIPFPWTEADREEAGDPRPSITRRYTSREEYLGHVGLWAVSLVQDGYLLADDLAAIDAAARDQWDWLMAGGR